MNSFEQFSQLHQDATPLLLGNIWDVNSAKLFESAGYKAIGTSSMAVANTFGYQDGEQMGFETLLHLAKRVVQVVNIPLTVDIEGGYSQTIEGIIQNIEGLHDVGVVGVNIEDSTANPKRQFQAVSEFQAKLSKVADHLSQKNIDMFLNVRTDGFLLGVSDALIETLSRIKAYENSGASGIFVPCITDKNDIREVVESTRIPINVMCMPGLPGFEDLKLLGVKRISMGPFVKNFANQKTEEAVKAILAQNNFSVLFQ
jgi:2-methylisocitrate lyase-like PEP mutase family enzyme